MHLITGVQYLTEQNTRLPPYLICCGGDPASLNATPELSFLSAFISLSIALSLVVGGLILREKRRLNELQNSTLDSLGLPRPPGQHPSVQYLVSHFILTVLVASGVVNFAVLARSMSEGAIDRLPYSLTIPVYHTLGPLQFSYGIPIMVLMGKGKVSGTYRNVLSSHVYDLLSLRLNR